MVRALRTKIYALEHGQTGDLATIREQIRVRDQQDMSRALDPLKKVSDAIEIDTSEMTIEEVVDRIVELAEKHV